MERNIYALKTVFIIVVFLFLHQFFAYGESFGYKPVDDPLGYYEDNYLYEKWCEETFENGKYVYRAYRAIFKIKYTPEPSKTDFWQTPLETFKRGAGDCEDVVFLFSDYLSQSQDNAKIVWGWVTNKKSGIGKAHTWCEIIARDGEEYVVEGFSRDWNGIIPMQMIEKTESREPTLTLSCSEFNKLRKSFFSPKVIDWNIQIFPEDKQIYIFRGSELAYGQEYWIDHELIHQTNVIFAKSGKKKITDIFYKLHELFSRRNNGE